MLFSLQKSLAVNGLLQRRHETQHFAFLVWLRMATECGWADIDCVPHIRRESPSISGVPIVAWMERGYLHSLVFGEVEMMVERGGISYPSPLDGMYVSLTLAGIPSHVTLKQRDRLSRYSHDSRLFQQLYLAPCSQHPSMP